MGLLDSDMSLLGLGLLASAGPSPMGVPQGIGQGLLMGRSLMEDARKSRSETRRAQLAEQKFAFEMEQARQAQREAERRNAAMAQFRETLPEGMRGLFDIAPGPVATGLLGQMMPKPTEAPTSYQEYELAQRNGYTGSYQDFLTTVKRNPPVSISLGGGFKPPEGFLANDPNNPDAGVRPIRGGPRDPNYVGPTEAKESRDLLRNLDGGKQAAQDLLARVERYGTEVVGQMSGEMGVLYGQVIAGMAAMRNMGVLQPGELAVLQSQLPDPSKLRSMAVPNSQITAALRQVISIMDQAQARFRQGTQTPASPGAASQPMTLPSGQDVIVDFGSLRAR